MEVERLDQGILDLDRGSWVEVERLDQGILDLARGSWVDVERPDQGIRHSFGAFVTKVDDSVN